MATKKRRTRGDGAFFQRADGKWMGRVELPPDRNGNRRYKWVSSVDRNTAMAKLKQLRRDVEEGRIATTSSTTVEKWMLHWIDNIHAKRKVRPGVLNDYRAAIHNHINPILGAKRIDKLTPQHVRDLHSEIGASRTAELVHVIVQKALDDAVAEGVATRNVAALVDKPEYRKKKRNGFPADVAQHIIHTAFQVCDEPDAVRIAAGFLTGARRGELLGLRWPYVDNPAQGWITIAWQLQSETRVHGCGDPLPEPSPLSRPDRMPKKPPYWPCGKTRAWACPQSRWDLPAHFEYQECEGSLLFTRPKTDAGWREVPLLPPLYVAMQKLRTDNPHDLVWHKEGKPIDPRSDYDVWRGVFRAAGVIGPTESLPPHNSRHTTSTLLRAAGVDEQTRMEILGHASVDAQRIYAHADRARHLEAMQGLSELLPSTFALETK
ncbi:tyrosine integrase [Mycobacterium phage Girr]|uniref:Integrase n=10 Tax=Cheoctovirus TaxID=1623281 RepID=A0A2S1PAZ4_9CAUD|nr:endonuclease [Mycobacterium phage DillTech15]YP_009957660.1 endonuclease [Mycobacterium phage Girr]ATN88537.1 tyrosine integrase [Mycobacterium phage DaWorst]AXQ65055.1 tyrosine integrase [Mycobacterium phage Ruby]QAY06141.1 tyrosine integrase [Mycobacterium phage MisterCuddles]AWH13745.1 tyrosine integrase [Mycobacterium phage DillTech15]AXQ60993.1 tyrosine integrase [Mycobacterium phage Girr]